MARKLSEDYTPPVTTPGIPEAPNDGKQYARKNMSWQEVVSVDGGGGGNGAAAGDIISSVRPLTPPAHLLCNGMLYANASYPQLAGICFPAIGVKYDAVSARPEAGEIRQFAVGASTIMAIGNTTLWRSTDGGVTWVNQGRSVNYASRIATDGAGHWMLVEPDGSGYPQLQYSANDGASWSLMTWPVSVNSGEILYAGLGKWVAVIGNSTYVTTDNGASWGSEVTLGYTSGCPVASDNNGTLIAALYDSPGTIRRSTDGGSTWADVAGQVGYGSMNGAACDGTGKWILSPAYSAELLRSTDNGATWESIPVPAALADGLQPCGHYNGVWVAFTSVGVVASNDFGESWHLAIGLPGVFDGGNLVVDASGNSYYLVANGGGGLYKSTPDASQFAVPNNFTDFTAKLYIVTGET